MPVKKNGDYEKISVVIPKRLLEAIDSYNKKYAPNLTRSQLISTILNNKICELQKGNGSE